MSDELRIQTKRNERGNWVSRVYRGRRTAYVTKEHSDEWGARLDAFAFLQETRKLQRAIQPLAKETTE